MRNGQWKTKRLSSTDAANEPDEDMSIQSEYRVLLTRGIYGCVVYFADPETADYFRVLNGEKPNDSKYKLDLE